MATTWLPLAPAAGSPRPTPCARRGHSATARGGTLYIYGGCYGLSAYLGDLHALDVKTMRWDEPRTSGKPPGPRAWHSATLALAPHSADYLFIFGGACRGAGGAMNCLNDLHVLATQLVLRRRLPLVTTAP